MTQSSGSSSPASPPAKVAKSDEERLMVAVRIRPLRPGEPPRVVHAVDAKVLVLEDEGDKNDVLRQKRGNDRQYVYDVVFGEDSTQEEVYARTTRGLVRDVLRGFNATVFAYGATGSGKTHTMVGSAQHPGVMLRALNDLFMRVRRDGYSVTMSYMEIYNENIRDLLNPTSGFLELREDSKGRNIQVAGLTHVSTTSTDEVMQLLQKGNRARTVEPTAANKTSSRSHALLSVTVKHTAQIRHSDRLRTRVKQGRLFMIDLAGSERASITKNRGKRLQEGAHINRSLLALGNCINALSGGARYVNYRDSKLTRLLKDALSGNCRTVMVAHVSPSIVQREETRNTLLYAERAKHISHKVERNVLDVSYHISQYRAIISELRDEIARLKSKMQEERPRSGGTSHNRDDQLKTLREQIVDTFKEQMKLRRRLMELDGHLLALTAEAERQHILISQWESQHSKLYQGSASRWHQKRLNTDDTDKDWLEDRDSSDAILQQAWAELSYLEREKEKVAELRAKTEKELESCRKRGVQLEDELPTQISSEEERELLALMCRVHELEVEKMALQSERLIKQHELRRRDIVILRYDRQRQLCEEIITRQRQLMEEGSLSLPPDLQELYQLYQREIHAATYADGSPGYQSVPFSSYTRDKEKLPPINQNSAEPLFQRSMKFTGESNRGIYRMDTDEISLQTPSSSAGSDYISSPLPPLQEQSTQRFGQPATLPSPSVLFPPISTPVQHSHESSNSFGHQNSSKRTSNPRIHQFQQSAKLNNTIRRSASDDHLTNVERKHPTPDWPQ